MKKLLILSMSTIISFWLFDWNPICTSVWADEEIKKDEKEDNTSKEPLKTETRAKVMAEFFKVPESTVLELREKKMGWGEISHLLALAQKSNQTVETILDLRQKGMGWGEIAHKYNLKLGMINKEVHAVKREFKRTEHPRKHMRNSLDRKERHPEKFSMREFKVKSERSEKIERPERGPKVHSR